MPPSIAPRKPQTPEGLIKLIQAANQHNHELQNRITELEDALEQSRQALQAELDRPEETPSAVSHEASSPEMAQQVNYLLNQLEFAQQANQRQEILVETLSRQLQSIQGRVAELENECQRLQQTVTTQTIQLQQSEAQCSDLQARLLRQQQYTLQFKSALEKCLEVPPPSYETAAAYPAVGYSQPFEQESDEYEPGEESVATEIPVTETVLPQATVTLSMPRDIPAASELLTNADAVDCTTDARPDPAKLVEAFFPKVDEIKPWSAQELSQASDGGSLAGQPHVVKPDDEADDEATDTGTSHNTPDALFQSKFHNTLRELANTDLTQPVDEAPQPTPSDGDETNAQEGNVYETNGNKAIATESALNGTEMDAPQQGDAVNGDSSNTVDSSNMNDSAVDPANDGAPSLEAEPKPSPWRSLMPPKLYLEKNHDETGATPPATPEILLPGESRQPSQSVDPPTEAPPPDGSEQIASRQLANPLEESATEMNESPEDDHRLQSQDEPQSQDEMVWHDLAQLVHATTDDIVRAQQANTFSVFNPDARNEEPSLLEIFSPSTSENPSHTENTIPFNLSISSQDKSRVDDKMPDPWVSAPGSYLNAASSSDKSSGIPPLSFGDESPSRLSSLRNLLPQTNAMQVKNQPIEASPASSLPQGALAEASLVEESLVEESADENARRVDTVDPDAVHSGQSNDEAVQTSLKHDSLPTGSEALNVGTKFQDARAMAEPALGLSPDEQIPTIAPLKSDSPLNLETHPGGRASLPTDDMPPPKRPSLSTILFARPGFQSSKTPGAIADKAERSTARSDGALYSTQENPPMPQSTLSTSDFRCNTSNWPSPLLYPMAGETSGDKQNENKSAKSSIDLPAFLK